MTSLSIVLAAGWGLQLGTWVWAMSRAGARAAHPSEWVREIAIRAVMVVLIAAALTGPRGALFASSPAAIAVLATLFIGAQVLASAARLQLGARWGIGVRPVDPAAPAYRGGVFRFVRHPMYSGTMAAALAQALLLQNVASVLLAASGSAVVAIKVSQEARWVRARTPEALPVRRAR